MARLRIPFAHHSGATHFVRFSSEFFNVPLQLAVAIALTTAAGCDRSSSTAPVSATGTVQGRVVKNLSLVEARRRFKTMPRAGGAAKEPVPEPTPEVFTKISYPSPAGPLAAYLTPDPNDGAKHPAIIWITGGDCNTIGDVWSDAPPSNDQTACAFRKAGIIMMFPSLRGGNDNPGVKEGFFGEVDDVVAAADFLAKQPYVDAGRIYLGGHSTGGTLALLVAECSDRFRAVFSFGPAADVAGYPDDFLAFDTSNARELELRSPGRWLASIKVPTFAIEGTVESNLESLRAMARVSTNPQAHFLEVQGADHFSVLAPISAVLADKILRDDGPPNSLTITDQELAEAYAKRH